MVNIRKKMIGDRIFLNALLLNTGNSYRNAGISGYSRQLLERLPFHCHEAKGALFWAFIGDPEYVPPPGIIIHRPSWSTRQPLARILWEQTLQIKVIQQLAGELLHGLAFAAPIAVTVPTIITIHDLSFFRYPQAFPFWQRRYLRWVTRQSAQRAAAIIAVSENTKQDVIRLLDVPEERVQVVYNGVDRWFQPLPAEEVDSWRQQQGLPEQFILYVGTLQPRKNIELLIHAYAAWRERSGNRDIPLILAGAKGWYYQKIFSLVDALGLSEAVRFPGFLPADSLRQWYSAATVFAYPSLYEGFGLPALEAMGCGTPVVAAAASSLPEVIGEAGLLVSPMDIDAWADALGRLLADYELRRQLGQQGAQRARTFNWDKTASETIAVYRRILG